MPQTPSTRETLRFLLNQHGIGLCFSVEKCRMLLMENCLGHKREIDLLATAIEQEITSEILRLKKAMPVSILLPKLTRWLTHKTEGSDEDCRWVVDSWAMALGIIPFCECELSNPELNQVGCHPHFTN